MARRGCAGPHPRIVKMRHEAAGYCLVDLLFVLAILAIVSGMAVAPLLTGLERARARAAIRFLAAQLGAARAQAVMRGTTVALQVDSSSGTPEVALVADGNGNGVRSAEIATGLDGILGSPVLLQERFAGIELATADAASGTGGRRDGLEILSFTPVGTSVSRSLYVVGRDGSRFAIRIAGITGRVRAERFEERSGAWLPFT